jgi:hypothetical protein
MKLMHLTKILTSGSYYREDEGDPVREREQTTPVTINADAVRCFNPRREGKPGTRVTFTDGGGFAVKEGFADVLRYFETGELPTPRTVELANVETGGNA